MAGNDSKIRIIIVGAGKAGELLSGDILERRESPFEIIGFVDDDPAKQAKTIQGASVLGKLSDLRELVSKYGVEELFIAVPSQRGKVIRDIIDNTVGLGLVYKILPRSSEVLSQDFTDDYLKLVRKVQPEDLLGGEILESDKSDQTYVTMFTHGKTVMVTGAAGSIGSELTRQIASHEPEKVVVYDWWENGMFDLRNQLLERYPETMFEFIIGDVKDRKHVDAVMERFHPHTVLHAAAYKHVPLMEGNPSEAIKNNIVGTKTVAETAIKNGVEKFVLVSTDKAVNPTNIMGASKRAAEQVIHILSASQSVTTFCAVRFGNVINSNGSAIPTFQKQIAMGGPVTVTHKDITRFFMTIPEAVHLILRAWVMGENNDLFVLDMGEPVKIYDLARALIVLEGYQPDVDIKLDIVGLRPGEKLYEEVLVKEEETEATSVKKVFRTQSYMDFDKLAFLNTLATIVESVEDDNLKLDVLKKHMQELVTTYKPSEKLPNE